MVAGAVVCGGIAWMPPGWAQTAYNNQALYELMNRMSQLEQEIRQLRGDMERNQYRQKGLERRLEELESRGAVAPSQEPGGVDAGVESSPDMTNRPGYPIQSPPPDDPQATVTPPPSVPSLQRSEQEEYDAAFNTLREGQYDQAITHFQTFLTAYPNGLLAANAQYWLGETYYAIRDYLKAKDAFLKLGAQHPKSDKLPEAMLKLGYIYEVTGDKNKARQMLEKLVQTYPNSRAAGLAETRLRAL
jgi:tol-pal system protein YbgF